MPLPPFQRLIRELAACGVSLERLANNDLATWERDIHHAVIFARMTGDRSLLKELLGEESRKWKKYMELQEEFDNEAGD